MTGSSLKPAPPNRSKGGRPVKFDEPSRHVTLTLPVRILERLSAIDGDRAKAIVKAVEAALGGAGVPPELVHELRIDESETLLTVADNRLLRSIPWLTMIEIAPGRHLISLKRGASIEKLEVALGDLLDEDHPDASPAERATLERLLDSLRKPRRSQALRTEEILVIETRR